MRVFDWKMSGPVTDNRRLRQRYAAAWEPVAGRIAVT